MIIAMMMSVSISGCSSSQSDASETVQVNAPDIQQDLIIPVSEITETAKFYPIAVDGTNMEVFAVKDSNGNIRTAYNTCQSCYTSGNGRYETEGTDLVCQNCGFHFTADQVGNEKNSGCSPWAISPENRTDTDETITISYDFLQQSKSIFANWQ